MQITCYSIITSVFKDDLIKYITYIEIYAGLGLTLGPCIGSLFYFSFHFGFEYTMYAFGIINSIGMFICMVLIPSNLNKVKKDDKIYQLIDEIK